MQFSYVKYKIVINCLMMRTPINVLSTYGTFWGLYIVYRENLCRSVGIFCTSHPVKKRIQSQGQILIYAREA